jgi:hypothetical protein
MVIRSTYMTLPRELSMANRACERDGRPERLSAPRSLISFYRDGPGRDRDGNVGIAHRLWPRRLASVDEAHRPKYDHLAPRSV